MSTFKASNGIRITSNSFPEYKRLEEILFVRGTSKSRDNEVIKFRELTEFMIVMDAIKEYNEKMKENLGG
jgi:hypothetical protein